MTRHDDAPAETSRRGIKRTTNNTTEAKKEHVTVSTNTSSGHRQTACHDARGERIAWCSCWWDGRDAGWAAAVDYGRANPDPQAIEQHALEWLRADAAAHVRGVADMLSDEHTAQLARDAAGLARARARWDTTPKEGAA